VAAGPVVWDIARPSGAGRPGLPGVTMAGFRERTAGPVDLGVVPYPAVTVIVDLGDDGLVVVDDAGHRHDRGTVVAGLTPGRVRGRGRDVACLQIRLSPIVATTVFGGEPLTGAVVPLDALWGPGAARVHEQLRSAPTWDRRFAIADGVLARRHDAGRPVDREVAHAWRRMTATAGRVRIDGLADEVGWSRKRLWSRFRSQVGLTPKLAARLVRFDRAAHRLAAGGDPARVAAESGYADQPHLHREVRAFTGATPTTLAAAPWLSVDDVAWPSRSAG
jgi:AraC-like DNA-binding protein